MSAFAMAHPGWTFLIMLVIAGTIEHVVSVIGARR